VVVAVGDEGVIVVADGIAGWVVMGAVVSARGGMAGAMMDGGIVGEVGEGDDGDGATAWLNAGDISNGKARLARRM